MGAMVLTGSLCDSGGYKKEVKKSREERAGAGGLITAVDHLLGIVPLVPPLVQGTP